MLRDNLSQIWLQIQGNLFPWISEEIGVLNEKQQQQQQQLISILEVLQVESYFTYGHRGVGHPGKDKVAIARAFVAKAVYNMTTTRSLIDRLNSDIKLRRICGWERPQDIPKEWDFSRAFKYFSDGELTQTIHNTLISKSYENDIISHINRDSTAIDAREKVVKVPKPKKPKRKVGRPKNGEIVI